MMTMEIFGWLSAFFLGACGIPQAYHSWKVGKAEDVSWSFLIMWLLGEMFGTVYVLNFNPIPWPLFANYILNAILIMIVLKYKIKPRGAK